MNPSTEVQHHSQPPSLTPMIATEGIIIYEESPSFILCKPKLMPMKSVTIEKLEQLQHQANEKAKRQMQQQQEEENLIKQETLNQ